MEDNKSICVFLLKLKCYNKCRSLPKLFKPSLSYRLEGVSASFTEIELKNNSQRIFIIFACVGYVCTYVGSQQLTATKRTHQKLDCIFINKNHGRRTIVQYCTIVRLFMLLLMHVYNGCICKRIALLDLRCLLINDAFCYQNILYI